MNREKIEKLILLALFIAAPFILFLKGFSPSMMLIGYDTVTLGLPFRMFAKEMLFTFRDLPVWLPDIMMGVPLINAGNLVFFYPLNLLMLLLPVPVNMVDTILVIIHMLLGGAGLYLFAGRMGSGGLPALFGGFCYMMCPAIFTLVSAGHMGVLQSAAFIPFVFYFFKRGVDEGKISHFLAAGACLAMMALCLMFQLAVYTALAASVFLVYELMKAPGTAPKKAANFVFYLAATAAMAFLLSALQVLPTFEYMKHSWRRFMDYHDFTERSFLPLEALSFVLPGFSILAGDNPVTFAGITRAMQYCGILPVLLLPYAFINKEKRGKAVFFSITALVFAILSFGGYTPVYRLFYYLPLFNSFRHPERFLFIVNFIVAFMAAISLDNILRLENTRGAVKKILLISGVPALLGMLGLISSFAPAIPGWFKSYYISRHVWEHISSVDAVMKIYRGDFLFLTLAALFAAAVVFAKARLKPMNAAALAALLILTHFGDVYGHSLKYINFRDYTGLLNYRKEAADFIRQDRALFRVHAVDRSAFPNENLYYDLEELKGYHGNAPYKLGTLDAEGTLDNIKVNRLYNVKYYISDTELPGLKKVYDRDVKIYRDDRAKPRFYASDRVIKAANENEALNMITSGNFDLDGVIATDEIKLAKGPGPLKYSVDTLLYTPNKIKLRATVDKEAVLVHSATYNENWSVKVDGIPGKIYNVNYLASGVVLKKGSHEVEFDYGKRTIMEGLLLTMVGIFLYLLVFLYEKRKMGELLLKGGKLKAKSQK